MIWKRISDRLNRNDGIFVKRKQKTKKNWQDISRRETDEVWKCERDEERAESWHGFRNLGQSAIQNNQIRRNHDYYYFLRVDKQKKNRTCVWIKVLGKILIAGFCFANEMRVCVFFVVLVSSEMIYHTKRQSTLSKIFLSFLVQLFIFWFKAQAAKWHGRADGEWLVNPTIDTLSKKKVVRYCFSGCYFFFETSSDGKPFWSRKIKDAKRKAKIIKMIINEHGTKRSEIG